MVAWHVALLTPGSEIISAKSLSGLGHSTIWPRWAEKVVQRGRIFERTRALAPGYMFVEFDGTDSLAWHEVRDACGEGFRSFIGGEYPVQVSDSVIEQFLEGCLSRDGLMAAPGDELPVGRVYKPGERVALSGVLGAAEGRVVWSDNRGVRITVNLFARPVEMWVPRGSAMLEEELPENTTRPKPRRRRRVRKSRSSSR